jgi:hypothetical protein
VTAAWNATGRAAPQSEAPQEAQAEAAREMLRGLDLDVRTLARELDGREGADLEVARRAVDRIPAVLLLAARCGQVAAGRHVLRRPGTAITGLACQPA